MNKDVKDLLATIDSIKVKVSKTNPSKPIIKMSFKDGPSKFGLGFTVDKDTTPEQLLMMLKKLLTAAPTTLAKAKGLGI